MKLMKALALAIVLALLPSVASAATPSSVSMRYGTGTFTVGNAQLLSSGCFYHPYTVNLNVGYETTDWDVDVRIMAPNGSIADLNFITGVGVGTGALAEEFFICSSLDQSGTYTITGTLNTYEGTYDFTPTKQALVPVQFQVLPYVAPLPPAPPVVAPITADVAGTVTSSNVTRGVKLNFATKALPAGTVMGNKVTWTVLLDGKIRKTLSQGPSARQSVKVTSPARSGQHVVKVLRDGKAVKTVKYRA